MMRYIFQELKEEAADFFDDFGEALFDKPRHPRKPREIRIGGVVTTVRPAILFAERIDSTLKIIFGLSICISAFTASFVGFTKLSDLLAVLIFSVYGRILMSIIGLSYILTALWKFLNIKDAKEHVHSISNNPNTKNDD